MKSNVSVTLNIDDPALAAEELAKGALEGFALEKNSVGLLFCYADMELGELLVQLEKLLPFEVVGCTAVATMDGNTGFQEMACTLMVLTADDCEMRTARSAPITPENVRDEIERTYRAAAPAGAAPGLIVAFAPHNPAIMFDIYAHTFNRVAPDIPLVGGVPSMSGSEDDNATICNGEVTSDRLVVLTISGNIRPVFVVKNVQGSPVERKRKVTSSKGNVVYRVGEQSFTEYAAGIGIPLSLLTGEGNKGVFIANPLLVEEAVRDGGTGGYAYVRPLISVNPEVGSGTAFGCIPEGSMLSVCPLNRDEIARAAGEAIGELRAKINAAGCSCSTVFVVSCIARYLLMSPQGGVEAEALRPGVPEGASFCGFYGYGELGPISGGQGAVNFAHNESLVMCAF